MITLNGRELGPIKFPDGTSQVTGLDCLVMMGLNELVFDFDEEAEIFQLIQVLDYCDSCYNTRGFNPMVNLHMSFLPYGRQDKSISEEFFAKGTFTRLLKNFTCLNKITSLDVHSNDVNYCDIRNIEPVKEIMKALIKVDPSMICYPDLGAKTRYGRMSILENYSNCYFTKERNKDTGGIERLYLNELVDIEGQSVLVVDDICDGGMTFKLTAEKLLTLGAKEVNLYTTHGIYSKGIETLRDSGISRIFNRNGEVTKDPTPPKDMIESELSNI